MPKVIGAIKGNSKEVNAIKGIAISGTALLTTGLALVTDGVVIKDAYSISGGAILIVTWLLLVERMGGKIKDIDKCN